MHEAPPEEQNFEMVMYMIENGGAKPYVHIPGLDYSLDDLDFPVDSLDDIEIIELEETP